MDSVKYTYTTLDKIPDSTKELLEVLTNPNGLMKHWLWECENHPVSIAKLDNKIIGWAIVHTNYKIYTGKTYNFIGCYVNEEYRSKGVGRKLSSLVVENIANSQEMWYMHRAEKFYKPIWDKYNKIVCVGV